ncbi:hypothetical protein GWN26_06060, partial [Candidatus Saccharibacteria bacterium]|nr:hypothetical protein [Candidatus Saccharibacteria bacterium]
EMLLSGMLKLTNEERDVIQQMLDKMIHERAGSSSAAKLTNPINIGIGTK